MKKLLPLLFCLTTGLAQAQAPASALRTDPNTQLLTRSEVVEVPGASEAALYTRAQSWLAAAYQTTKETANTTPSVVRGSGWREIEMLAGDGESLPLRLWYTVTITVQPAHYTYDITEFQTQPEPTATNQAPAKQAIELVLRTDKTAPAARTDYGQQAADAAQGVAETIKASMDNPTQQPALTRSPR